MKGTIVNEKLTKLKNRVKNQIKDHAPELITLGVSAVALVTYAAYVMNSDKTSSNPIEDNSVEIIPIGDDGHMVMSAEAYENLNSGRVSKIQFDYRGKSYDLSKTDGTNF